MARIDSLASFPDGMARLCRLWGSFNSEQVSVAELERRIVQSETKVFLLVDDEQFCGFACGSVHSTPLRPHPYFELEAIYVDPKFRRKGWGAALLNAVKRAALEAQCESLHVSSLISPELGSFYDSQGFVHYADRSLLMF